MKSSFLEVFYLARSAQCERKTIETRIFVKLNLDGNGEVIVSTGIPFFDHMLELMCHHALLDAEIKASGDLEVDSHHTVEDTGIVIGNCLAKALGDKSGINRFGLAIVPMDECLAECVIDISGRPYLFYKADISKEPQGNFDPALTEDFFRSLVNQVGITAHIELRRTGSVHHSLEAIFKAFGRALKQAVDFDPRVKGVPSTKGII
ncbi:MAG: imidazoleglycerol-phosphate dehydratase HisB [Actinomycetota bacterium]|nr:imidazoleglycerol-phosphate dehydratase HisB [Actinomycetota bacterium]